MIQTVDVVAIFDRMIREPKPVRFKIYDSGHWKSVNVERILNIEWMRLDGKVQSGCVWMVKCRSYTAVHPEAATDR